MSADVVKNSEDLQHYPISQTDFNNVLHRFGEIRKEQRFEKWTMNSQDCFVHIEKGLRILYLQSNVRHLPFLREIDCIRVFCP